MAPVNRLYQVPLGEFVKARDALARELRDNGEGGEAKRVASLRKPAAALWVANQLARAAPKEIGALIAATARARDAQAAAAHGKGGDELREVMREQREALQKLTLAAAAAAVSAGVGRDTAAARGKGGDELREVMREQREALQKLTLAAAAAALSAGMAPNHALERRVQNTV